MMGLGLGLGLGPMGGADVAFDFAGGALPATMTFTRASTATYQNVSNLIASAAINAARFDYTSGASTLLIEPSRTNQYSFSEAFDNAAWTKIRATITANATTAPDGAATADKLVEDATAANNHVINRASTVVLASTSDPRSFSFFAKADTRTKVRAEMVFVSGCFAVFDLAAGTVFSSGSVSGGTAPTAVMIGPLPGGWYLCSLSATFSAGNVGNPVSGNIFLCNAAGAEVYNGDGTSGAFIWGAQIEVGALPTSYIPTAGAAGTRSADAASFTIPAGVATLRYTFDNATTQDVAVAPGAYIIPTNLNRPRIASIISL